MQYLALAVDYDGTIATGGRVTDETFEALQAVKRSGRRLIMVTGREVDDLRDVFGHLGLFDLVVAENGALLLDPATQSETVLGEAPDPRFISFLERSGVTPLSVGRVIVATREPYEVTALDAIRELGLELQIIFNKGAVMVLPGGINKATGLAAGLERLGLDARSVVGVGDAENDHAFLAACGRSVAVANALPALKAQVDLVTAKPEGAGVAELVRQLIATDLQQLPERASI